MNISSEVGHSERSLPLASSLQHESEQVPGYTSGGGSFVIWRAPV